MNWAGVGILITCLYLFGGTIAWPMLLLRLARPGVIRMYRLIFFCASGLAYALLILLYFASPFSWINILGAPPLFVLFAIEFRKLFKITKNLATTRARENKEANTWILCMATYSLLIILEFWAMGWIDPK